MTPQFRRDLADGRTIFVIQQIFNTVVTIGGRNSLEYDEEWTYPSWAQAIEAAINWDVENKPDPPVGWIRHVPSWRRRPDGDPARETVRP